MSTPTDPPSTADPWPDGFTLGDWRVDVSGNRLQRGAEVRPLRHKAMELLVLLARNAGRTVTRDEIIDAVWAGNRFVAPKAINTAVWTIRQTLGDDPDAPRYLETIAKKGYRLVAPVIPLATAAAAAADIAAGLASKASNPRAASPPRPVRHRWPAKGLGAGVLLLALAGVALHQAREPAPPAGRSGAPAPALPPVPEVLTQEPGVEYLGALSPDGARLAYAWWRGRGAGALYLREIGMPSRPPLPLAAAQGDVNSLAWAPDGSSLAFTALAADGRCTVWLQPVPVAGSTPGTPRAIAECAPLRTQLLAWSPDGMRIVFSAERDGAGGLFAVDPDGQGMQRLTTAPPSALPDHQPAWAPDGSHLAFLRQDPADGTRDLHEWRPGGEVRRLTTLKLHAVHGLTHAANGRDLVFSTTRQDSRVLQRWQRDDGRVVPLGVEGSAPVRAADGSLVYALLRTHVSIARLVFGGAPVRAIQGLASDRVPRQDPAGTRLAFVSSRSGSPELWLAAIDGSAPRALTSLGGVVESIAWSPAGDRLAFVGSCGPGGRIGLCTVAAAGGVPQPLATDAATYAAPAWHPQRNELWVASDRGGSWQLWRFAATGGAGRVEPTALPPGRALQWLADGSGFVYQPRSERHLRWRTVAGPQAGQERRLEVVDSGEELVDWQLDGLAVTTLSRSDHDRWRRVDLPGGRRQALGEHPLGTLPERARFALAGPGAVWVEVANTQVADLMRLR